MACGTAVVASRVGGIPEVVADGETGLLVPPGDPPALARAINALVTDERRAAEMGRPGRKRAAADFGWGNIAAQTAALYAELAGDRPPSQGSPPPGVTGGWRHSPRA